MEERLTRIEVKLEELRERVTKLEKAIYGDANPTSITQRLSSLESKVSILLKIVIVPIGLILANIILQLMH